MPFLTRHDRNVSWNLLKNHSWRGFMSLSSIPILVISNLFFWEALTTGIHQEQYPLWKHTRNDHFLDNASVTSKRLVKLLPHVDESLAP